jgi:aldose 1-epimerase
MDVSVCSFGSCEGKPVDLYRVENENGMVLTVSNYGGVVTGLQVPDRAGRFDDVVLGYDTLDGYLGDGAHLGALVGRYGNRIAGGRFEIDGKPYALAKNNGSNHLHGGNVGFDRRVWDGEVVDSGVKLIYVSPDGEEGYPGCLTAELTVGLTEANALVFSYRAETDATTHVNLTHHGYFNLSGSGDILDHELTLYADLFTPVDSGLIPTGELRAVDDTPFDFREGAGIGERIDDDDDQLAAGGGYDHNFVLSGDQDGPGLAATVIDSMSGRRMDVFTTEPGVQFYTGNFLDGSIVGKNGERYEKRSGLCLETQHFPDTPNQPFFPSTMLRPGETYVSETAYRFGLI